MRDSRRRDRYVPRYALVHEEAGYEFLVDTQKLMGLSLITVRKGKRKCVVWVDEDEVSVEVSDFGRQETESVRALAQKKVEDLLSGF
ncbi:MAG: hypothetical protein ACT443_15375 [Gemmatimonadota bacterium]